MTHPHLDLQHTGEVVASREPNKADSLSYGHLDDELRGTFAVGGYPIKGSYRVHTRVTWLCGYTRPT